MKLTQNESGSTQDTQIYILKETKKCVLHNVSPLKPELDKKNFRHIYISKLGWILKYE